MIDHEEQEETSEELEASDDQIDVLRELGVPELDIQGLSMADAESLIAELREERQSARY